MAHTRMTYPNGILMATVLYVDDDETLRMIGAMALEEMGHEVILARDGDEALAAFEERGSEVALGLIDMSMPGMRGDEVVSALRDMGARIPLLICTGFDYQDADVRAMGATGLLRKPFRIQDLEHIVREALGG